MTSPNVWDPPPTYTMPVSLGRDIIVTFQNVVPGSDPTQYTDFPDGAAVKLVVVDSQKNLVAEGDGVVDGPNAVCRIESDLVDTFRNGYLWRCEVSIPDGVYEDDDVPINGVIKRYDGRP